MRAYELLNEYKATPTALMRMAKNIDALAGFEIELASPTAATSEFGGEPNYENDERAYSIDDIINFFYSDYMGRGDLSTIERQMREAYDSWMLDQMSEVWHNEVDQEEYVREYVNENFTDEELEELWLEKYFDIDEQGREPTPQELQNGRDQIIDELAEEAVEENNNLAQATYDEWSEEWLQNPTVDEQEWLRDIGIYMMSDAIGEYPDLIWPYYEEGVSHDEIAYEISQLLGVSATTNYRKGHYPDNTYLVTEDSSIENDEGDRIGFELVSPPLPIDTMLEHYRKIAKWAERNGYHTNHSTGLHMNVSIRNFYAADLDYVKLVLLLGEEYIAGVYDRFDDYHARSSLHILKRRIQQGMDDGTIDSLLDEMRKGLTKEAIDQIHNGWTDKYVSIHPHEGRVEFRFPGGNYLEQPFEVIASTLMRCVVALDAAVHPEKFRKEYLKKLYRMINPRFDVDDTLYLFTRAALGELPRSAFMSMVRNRLRARKAAKDPSVLQSTIPTDDTKIPGRVGEPRDA